MPSSRACSCSTTASRRASAAPSASSRCAAGGGRGPLLGVTLQAALHLGLALGEHPPTLGDAGHAHLERLAPPPHLGPPLLERPPGR